MRRNAVPIATACCLMALAASSPSAAAPTAERTAIWEWRGVSRVVAVGDLHGALEKFVQLLEVAGLVDSRVVWTGGDQHLVVAGDFLDRGPGDRDLMDLLRRLQREASAAGGRVHVLLGNHEVMNLLRNTRYLHPAAYRQWTADERPGWRRAGWRGFAASGIGRSDLRQLRDDFNRRFPPGFFARQRALDPEGEYGKWLLSLPSVVKIDGVLYLHGGMTDRFAALGVDEINRRVLAALGRHLDHRRELEERGVVHPAMTLVELERAAAEALGDGREAPDPVIDRAARGLLGAAADPVLGAEGPLWYRGNAWEDERIERRRVERCLELLAARAMVVAHSYTGGERITSRFDGRLFRLDHGILHSRRPLALVVERGEALVLDTGSGQVMRPIRELPPGMSRLTTRKPERGEELERLLSEGEVVASREIGRGSTRPRLLVLEMEDLRGRGVFKTIATEGDRYEHEVAAYRLDRRLGLGLVPPTVVRRVDGEEGSLQSWVEGAVDREAVAEYGLEFVDTLSSSRQRKRAELFDALIGNLDRRPSDVLRVLGAERLYLIDHSRAFPISDELPWPADRPVPIEPAVEAALERLDREWARSDLAGLLSEAQIDALLARRDRILGQVEIAGTDAASAPRTGPH